MSWNYDWKLDNGYEIAICPSETDPKEVSIEVGDPSGATVAILVLPLHQWVQITQTIAEYFGGSAD